MHQTYDSLRVNYSKVTSKNQWILCTFYCIISIIYSCHAISSGNGWPDVTMPSVIRCRRIWQDT
ncbi:hypothetical protein MITSMUL_04968 [Mitsuokella multacida DSM 20544]|uniref:Uncharacterized protein n=1 Tax=Mitsuokella multacida DSM 20544 TaxID=500635 RepID=C9KP13_9FIRM|nr:hypothetical protein MITSMUL_04968 [Mitsuokella multacida DSM 20544]